NETGRSAARPRCTTSKSCLVLRRRGEVASARLYLQAVPAAFDGDAPEATVLLGVGGRIGDNILSAQLLLDLLEGSLEFLAVVAHVDDASAGFLGQLFHGGKTAVAKVPVETAVGDENHVDQGVGALGRGDGFADLVLAALIFAIG